MAWNPVWSVLLGQCKVVLFGGEKVRNVFTCRMVMTLSVDSNVDITGILYPKTLCHKGYFSILKKET